MHQLEFGFKLFFDVGKHGPEIPVNLDIFHSLVHVSFLNDTPADSFRRRFQDFTLCKNGFRLSITQDSPFGFTIQPLIIIQFAI